MKFYMVVDKDKSRLVFSTELGFACGESYVFKDGETANIAHKDNVFVFSNEPNDRLISRQNFSNLFGRYKEGKFSKRIEFYEENGRMFYEGIDVQEPLYKGEEFFTMAHIVSLGNLNSWMYINRSGQVIIIEYRDGHKVNVCKGNILNIEEVADNIDRYTAGSNVLGLYFVLNDRDRCGYYVRPYCDRYSLNSPLSKTIREYLHKSGGATCREIEEALKMDHPSVSARLTEMNEYGYIYPYSKKKNKSTGRVGTIWRLSISRD